MRKTIVSYNVLTPREFFMEAHGQVFYNGTWIKDFLEFCKKIYSLHNPEWFIKDAKINDTHYFYDEMNDRFVLSYQDFDKMDPYGIENINFSICKPDDHRWEVFKKERLTKGYDETETWNLDHTIIRFMLPRIKTLKEIQCGYPARLESMEAWEEILDKITDALQLYLDTDGDCLEYYPQHPSIYDNNENKIKEAEENNKIFKEGWELLHEWFFCLGD